MKPKTLKFPFCWDERKPFISDDVLYVPKCYAEHEAWSKEELRAVFSSFPGVCIEYCSGNGTWIAEKAKQDPSRLWIAVEKRFDRVQRIWAKKHNLSLNNLFIVCGEALTFTKFYQEEARVDAIFVNFPDPWPKLKHAKNRLLQKPFISELYRTGKDCCEVVLVTDDVTYSEQMIREMTGEGLWRPVFPDPYYTIDWPLYGASYFEELWKTQGRVIRYMKFIK